jgi:hypothetical protein
MHGVRFLTLLFNSFYTNISKCKLFYRQLKFIENHFSHRKIWYTSLVKTKKVWMWSWHILLSITYINGVDHASKHGSTNLPQNACYWYLPFHPSHTNSPLYTPTINLFYGSNCFPISVPNLQGALIKTL